jgi:predicted DNA binding CopG/RHH family protein
MQKLNVRFSENLIELVKEAALKTGLTRSQVARLSLEKGLSILVNESKNEQKAIN